MLMKRLSRRRSSKSKDCNGIRVSTEKTDRKNSLKFFIKERKDDSIIFGYEVPEEYVGIGIGIGCLNEEFQRQLQEVNPYRRPMGVVGWKQPQGHEMSRLMQKQNQVSGRIFEKMKTKFGLTGQGWGDGEVLYVGPTGINEKLGDIDAPLYDWFSLSVAPKLVAKLAGEIEVKVPSDMTLSFKFYYNVKNTADANEEHERWGYAPAYCIYLGETKTNKAQWQVSLENNSLSSFVEPFQKNRLITLESWARILDDKQMIEELGIDERSLQLLAQILASKGFITEKEKTRLAKEEKELDAHADDVIKQVSKTEVYIGKPMIEKKTNKFCTVVNLDKKDELVAKFEDEDGDGESELKRFSDFKTALKPTKFVLFLSHSQAEAQNQVANLYMLLKERGVHSWYDMEAEELQHGDMANGIKDSNHFCIYLTRNYFERYFCRLESIVAIKLKKPLIVIFESDKRHQGSSDYVELVNAATAKYPQYRDWLLQPEAIPMARRAFQRRGMVEEILKRCGVTNSTYKTSSSKGKPKLETELERQLQNEVDDLKEEVGLLWSTIEKLQEQMEKLKN